LVLKNEVNHSQINHTTLVRQKVKKFTRQRKPFFSTGVSKTGLSPNVESMPSEVTNFQESFQLQNKPGDKDNVDEPSVSKKTNGRRSMFSSTRYLVERVSTIFLSKVGIYDKPGKMSSEEDNQLTEYSMLEISKHNTATSTWIVIHGRVYDVTQWMWAHPGRYTVLQDNGGKDATDQFESSFHSTYARDKAKQYVIGKVRGRKLGDLYLSIKNVNTVEELKTSGINCKIQLCIVVVSLIIFKILIIFFKKNN